MTTERCGKRTSLAANNDGAILVIGLVSAVFITALLYFVFGIGETIRHHERMNDGVDSGAYSVGVMHARAMNLVSLANMAKMAVVAVQSAYLAIITGAILVIVWILSGGYVRWIIWGWMIGPLVALIAQSASAYSGFRSHDEAIVEATDDLQAAIRDDLPTIALLKADTMVSSNYAPPVQGLVSAPDMTHELKGMPIDEGSVMPLCSRAFPFSAGMVLNASRDLPALKARFIGYSMIFILPYCMGYGVKPYEMTDSELGGEAFQIRVMAFGDQLPALGERGVQLATYLADDPGSRAIAKMRDQVSELSLAQSEYYFDGVQNENEFLWRMEWKARMRRYRGGGGGALGGILGGMLNEVIR